MSRSTEKIEPSTALAVRPVTAAELFDNPFELPEVLGVRPEIEEIRNKLALSAQKIQSITSAEDQERGVTKARDLMSYIKGVQAAALERRRPLNQFLAMVKVAEDDHLAPLIVEADRLKRLVGDFQRQEATRVAKEAKERADAVAAEAKKIADAQRLADERRAKAEASSKPSDARAATMAEKKVEVANASFQRVVAAPAPEVARTKGQSTRQVVVHKVTDEDALYAARPDLFKREIKASALKAVCIPRSKESTADKPDTSVPGLSMWWEEDVSFRKW